jgi:hypothetical protein
MLTLLFVLILNYKEEPSQSFGQKLGSVEVKERSKFTYSGYFALADTRDLTVVTCFSLIAGKHFPVDNNPHKVDSFF